MMCRLRADSPAPGLLVVVVVGAGWGGAVSSGHAVATGKGVLQSDSGMMFRVKSHAFQRWDGGVPGGILPGR